MTSSLRKKYGSEPTRTRTKFADVLAQATVYAGAAAKAAELRGRALSTEGKKQRIRFWAAHYAAAKAKEEEFEVLRMMLQDPLILK